jgi:hypothetical protein
MREFLSIAACGLLLAAASASCQTADKDGWGPWRYTDFKVSGIEFRSKCVSSTDADSKWAYQFRSRFGTSTVDFGERVEHGADGAPKNEFERIKRLTISPLEIGPVFKTQLHGTCAEVKELKIEIVCVTVPSIESPCYNDGDGEQVEPNPNSAKLR